MKKLLFLLFTVVLLASCGLSKKSTSHINQAPPMSDSVRKSLPYIKSYTTKEGIKVLKIGNYEYFGAHAAKFNARAKNKAEQKRLRESGKQVAQK